MLSQLTSKKMLFTIFSVLVLLTLLSACATQTPAPAAEEPAAEEPVAEEPAAEEPAAPAGDAVPQEILTMFPGYPETLPAHCELSEVQAGYDYASKYWPNPVMESSGYTPVVRPGEKRFKIGFVQGLGGFPADTTMVESATAAAGLMCVDLVFCDSKYEAEPAVNCAQVLKDQGVDGVINSNWVEPSMAAMAEILEGIPSVTNDVRAPNTIFYGVDNCMAGRLSGEYLVDWVKTNWTGDIADVWVVNPENPEVGEEPAKRISCMEEAVKAGLPEIPASQYARIPGGSFTDEAYEAMTTWLTANPDAGLVLATTINDQGAVGASTACDAASRACAVVGKGAEPQAWAELDKPAEESTFVATISYMFTEYGRYLVPIVLDQIEGKTVPDPVNNYIFTLDRANMSQFTGLRPPK